MNTRIAKTIENNHDQEQENKIIAPAILETETRSDLTSGEQTQDQEQEQTENGEDQAQVYQDKIYFLVDDFIDREYAGKTQEELKQDRAFFPLLVNYLNRNYLQALLHTHMKKGYKEPSYNIEQLDYIFNIYIALVYKYKWNNRPSLLEFSILTSISRDTINTWLNGKGDRQAITPNLCRIVKSWKEVCENALRDGNGEYVKEIFLLKSVYGYKDQDNTITIKHDVLPTIAAGDIPQLLGIGDKLT